MLQLQPFCGHFDTEASKAGEVVTWTVEARDKAYCDRVTTHEKNNRNLLGSRLGGKG